jgi:hypothetical protein
MEEQQDQESENQMGLLEVQGVGENGQPIVKDAASIAIAAATAAAAAAGFGTASITLPGAGASGAAAGAGGGDVADDVAVGAGGAGGAGEAVGALGVGGGDIKEEEAKKKAEDLRSLSAVDRSMRSMSSLPGNVVESKSSSSAGQRRKSSYPPPENYTCNRCGEKGHWITDCPMNTQVGARECERDVGGYCAVRSRCVWGGGEEREMYWELLVGRGSGVDSEPNPLSH